MSNETRPSKASHAVAPVTSVTEAMNTTHEEEAKSALTVSTRRPVVRTFSSRVFIAFTSTSSSPWARVTGTMPIISVTRWDIDSTSRRKASLRRCIEPRKTCMSPTESGPATT